MRSVAPSAVYQYIVLLVLSIKGRCFVENRCRAYAIYSTDPDQIYTTCLLHENITNIEICQ